MRAIRKHFDTLTILVIAATLVLFVSALFTKGLTHDILLEAAILLVSLKLIIMAYNNIDATDSLHDKLDKISTKLDDIEARREERGSGRKEK